MGFGCMPSLPIISVPFKFVKSLDLTSVGLGLASVPFKFGWELVEWKPKINQSRVDFKVKSVDEFVEVHDEIEIEDDQADGFGPQIELNLGTGSNPVRDFGDELVLEIEDHLADSFEKVGDIDLTEGEQTPTEPVPSIPTNGNLTGEEPRKKRVKTTAGRFDLPLVRKFLGLKSKYSSAQLKKSSTKSSVQPTRKSFRLASQSTFKPVQSSKDEPIVVEDINSSA